MTKPPHLVKDNSPQNLRKEEKTNKKSLKQEKPKLKEKNVTKL